MGRLNGKVHIITGALASIGSASAILFGEEGATLGLININENGGEQVVEQIRKAGGTAKYIKSDVSDAKEQEALIDNFVKEFGRVDILYNNAGGASARDDYLLKISLDEFDYAISLNLFGPFVSCRIAIPYMDKRGGGSIINTASTRAMIATQGADAYTSAKDGIVALTRALAVQCADKGIRVNVSSVDGKG